MPDTRLRFMRRRDLLLPYVHRLHTELSLNLTSFSPLAPSYTCYRDSAGNPECSLGGNSIPPTLTNTNVPNTDAPSGTFIGTSSTTPNGPSTAVLPPTTSSKSTSSPGPTPSSSNNSNGNSGLTSSAVPVVVNAILASLAGAGVFAHLF